MGRSYAPSRDRTPPSSSSSSSSSSFLSVMEALSYSRPPSLLPFPNCSGSLLSLTFEFTLSSMGDGGSKGYIDLVFEQDDDISEKEWVVRKENSFSLTVILLIKTNL